jgi:ribonucleotide reductase alpha subunit
MNLWVSDLNSDKLSSMYFYAWKKGLKTGQYYLRSRRAVNAKKMTVSASSSSSEQNSSAKPSRGRRRNEQSEPENKEEENIPACRRDNPDCLSCGS